MFEYDQEVDFLQNLACKDMHPNTCRNSTWGDVWIWPESRISTKSCMQRLYIGLDTYV